MDKNQSIPIDLEHDNYEWDDYDEEKIICQMEGDDKVPEMRSQEQIPARGSGGGIYSFAK